MTVPDTSKKAAYAALVERRKACRACCGLTNPSVVQGGQWDSEHIGPWSLWLGDLDAEIMVVAQDWGDVDYFIRNRGRDERNNPTNMMLAKLMRHAGYEIGTFQEPAPNARVFLTNAVLCLKSGGMQAKLNDDWAPTCGRRFLKVLVEIVAPKFVVAFGGVALEAVAISYGLALKKGDLKRVVTASQPIPLNARTSLLAVYHCSPRVLNTHRPLPRQIEDWKQIARHVTAT